MAFSEKGNFWNISVSSEINYNFWRKNYFIKTIVCGDYKFIHSIISINQKLVDQGLKL